MLQLRRRSTQEPARCVRFSVFFFSSRRRHTRSDRDWSSDVCSSDLVQVGDPFTEKLLLEACLEAMKAGAVAGIQDMGAAGLPGFTSVMPARAGTGMDGELSRGPHREVGMIPYQILLSQAQERLPPGARPGPA